MNNNDNKYILTDEDNKKFSKNMWISIITLIIGIGIQIYGIYNVVSAEIPSKYENLNPFNYYFSTCLATLALEGIIVIPLSIISIIYSKKCLLIEKNLLSKFIIVFDIILLLPLPLVILMIIFGTMIE